MKKALVAVIALVFVAGPAFAMKHEGPADDKLSAACKDKKPGTKVNVDGKEVACPKSEKKEGKGK